MTNYTGHTSWKWTDYVLSVYQMCTPFNILNLFGSILLLKAATGAKLLPSFFKGFFKSVGVLLMTNLHTSHINVCFNYLTTPCPLGLQGDQTSLS